MPAVQALRPSGGKSMPRSPGADIIKTELKKQQRKNLLTKRDGGGGAGTDPADRLAEIREGIGLARRPPKLPAPEEGKVEKKKNPRKDSTGSLR